MKFTLILKKEKKHNHIKDNYLYFMNCRDKIYNYDPDSEKAKAHKPWKKDKLKTND